MGKILGSRVLELNWGYGGIGRHLKEEGDAPFNRIRFRRDLVSELALLSFRWNWDRMDGLDEVLLVRKWWISRWIWLGFG